MAEGYFFLSYPNPDERDKCLLQNIFLQKNKKIFCKPLNRSQAAESNAG